MRRKESRFGCTAAGSALIALAVAGATMLCLEPAAEAQATSAQAVGMYNLGLSAYKQGSPESAIIFFKRACDIDPNLADAQYNLGVLYQSQKRLREAVPRYQEVLRVKPNDPDAHYQLALCFIDLGQSQDARVHLASIPPNNPHFADAQKRMQLIDQGAQGNQAAAPGTAGQAVYTPPPQTQVPPQSQPVVTSPPQSSPPQTGYPVTASQPEATGEPAKTAYIPNTAATRPPDNTQSPGQMQTPSQAQPPTQPESAAALPPPTPVLANASVRVIATGFKAPSGLAFDRNGNLYVANFNSNTIDRIASDGSRQVFSSGPNLSGPIGLCVDGTSNVYVANYKSGTVARITPAGISSVIATGFREPYYLALDSEGNLFVSQQKDNSIVRISLPRPVGIKP